MVIEEKEKELYGFKGKKGRRLFRKKFTDEDAAHQSWQKELEPAKPLISSKVVMPNVLIRLVYILFSAFILFLVLGIIYYGWFYFHRGDIELGLNGPNEVIAGEKNSYTVSFTNFSKKPINNVQIEIDLLDKGLFTDQMNSIKRVSIGSVSTGESRMINFDSVFFGLPPTAPQIEVSMIYQPESVSTPFEKKKTFQVFITKSGIEGEIKLSKSAILDQPLSFEINWENKTKNDFEEAEIQLIAPSGFEVLNSSLEPVKANTWRIKEIKTGDSGTILINGVAKKITPQELKVVIGISKGKTFYVLTEKSATLEVISPPIALDIKINDNKNFIAKLGSALEYEIIFKNNSSIDLLGVIVSAQLNGKMFNLAAIEADEGFFNPKDGKIIWAGSETPSLARLRPGESGKVGFSVKTLSQYPIKSDKDKEFVLGLKVKVESATRPEGVALEGPLVSEAEIITKVAGDLGIQPFTYFNDARKNFSNTGSLPPRVGQVTQFAVYFDITNFSNTTKDIQIKAVLPTGVKLTNKFNSVLAEFGPNYNERTGQISITIPELNPGIGVLTDALGLGFQIEAMPSALEFGKFLTLVKDISVEAVDAFTGQKISKKLKDITTENLNDPSLVREKLIISQ